MYVNPIQAYKNYWRKTFRYNGYASRSEYWWTKLINVLIFILFGIITLIYCLLNINNSIILAIIWMIWLIFKLVCIAPNISLGWRRLRDTNIPGYIWFIHLVGLAGYIVFAILACLRTKGIRENVYKQQDIMRRKFAERNKFYVQ